METFFSGTDMAELHDNAGHYPYYLSLIVNHKSKYCAKIAIVGTDNRVNTDSSISFDGGEQKIELLSDSTPKQEVLVLIDMEIVIDQEEAFVNKVRELMTPPAKVVHHPARTFNGVGFGRDWENFYDSEADDTITQLGKTVSLYDARKFIRFILDPSLKHDFTPIPALFYKYEQEIKRPDIWAANLIKARFEKGMEEIFGPEYEPLDVINACVKELEDIKTRKTVKSFIETLKEYVE